LDEVELVKYNYPANVWPDEIPEFKQATVEAFKSLEKSGILMLRSIALFLGLDELYFDE
jgi:isopenicillin N synthase-like dioxygenase